MKKIINILYILTIAFVFNAYAIPTDEDSIKSVVIENCYLKKTGGVHYDDNSTITGFIVREAELEVIEENTWMIPNKLGTGFSLGVKFTEIPQNIQSLDLRIYFPEMILPNGKKRSSIERPIDISGHDGSYNWFFEYYFDSEFERSPGVWKIQVSLNEVVLHRSNFKIIQTLDDNELSNNINNWHYELAKKHVLIYSKINTALETSEIATKQILMNNPEYTKFKEVYLSFFEDLLSSDEYIDYMAKLYMQNFSVEELEYINNAFLDVRLRSYMKKSLPIMEQSILIFEELINKNKKQLRNALEKRDKELKELNK